LIQTRFQAKTAEWSIAEEKVGGHNCTSLQVWKEAILHVWFQRRTEDLVIFVPTHLDLCISRNETARPCSHDIYISRFGPPFLLQQDMQTDPRNKSNTDT
jgi:hypothetical protein